ncbi:MAG: multicopper oxidase domain-containing protein [Flavobacteriales bacterium]|nr:multicopper oxidase domain-containing protein [Flavobacteriales bacterium]
MTRLQLMPGERVELLLDLAAMQGQAMQLMAYNSELPDDIIGAAEVGNGMATLDGYDDNALNGADFPLVSFTVGAPLSNGTFQIPNTLVPVNPISEVEADLTRTFLVEPQFMSPMEVIEGPFTINGALMDMDSINVVVPLGSTEIWSFTNNTMVGHPIHIHDIQFNILDRNGAAPEPWETGWKDVVFVPAQGSARVITRFEDFADPDMPYMYHCHLLMHEDEGMMGQFLVVDPTSIGEALNPVRPVVWPNPSSTGHLIVSLPIGDGPADLRLYDALGRIAFTGRTSFTAGKARVVLPALAAGDYQLRITDQRGIPYAAHVILQH